MYHAINKLLNVVVLLVGFSAQIAFSMQNQSPPPAYSSPQAPPSVSPFGPIESIPLVTQNPPPPSGYFQGVTYIQRPLQQKSDHACRSLICLCSCIFGSGSCTGCFAMGIVAVAVILGSDVCERISNYGSKADDSNLQQTVIAAVDYDYPEESDSCPPAYKSLGVLKYFHGNNWHLDIGHIPQNLSSLSSTVGGHNSILNAYSKVLKSICLEAGNVSLCIHEWRAKLQTMLIEERQTVSAQLDRFIKNGVVENDDSTLLVKVVGNQLCERLPGAGL